MPTVSVRIDSHSKYTIEFDAEYSSPEEFVEAIRRHIKFVNEIASGETASGKPASTRVASGREDMNRPESPGFLNPEPDHVLPGGQFEKSAAPPKAASIFKRKNIVAGTLLYIAVALALTCGGAVIYLWHSDFGILTAEKAQSAVFKARISSTPDFGKQEGGSQNTFPPNSGNPDVKKGPPLPEINKLAIYASRPTWMKITEDNNPPYELMLQPGDKLEREASRFRLIVGDARGAAVAFNNKRVDLDDGKSTRRRGNVAYLKLPPEQHLIYK